MEGYKNSLTENLNTVINPKLDNNQTGNELTTSYEKTKNDIKINKEINESKKRIENYSITDKIGIAMESDNLAFNFVDSIFEKYDIVKDKNWDKQEGIDLINKEKYNFLTFKQKNELIENRNTSFQTLLSSIQKMKREYDNHKDFEQFGTVDSLLYTGGAVLLDPTNFLGGYGAYKAATTFATKTMLKSRLATTAVGAITEGSFGAAQEAGLYYTTDYKTVEDIAYAGVFSGIIGGPLTSFALKEEMTNNAKLLKEQLTLHNNTRNINKLTETDNLKYEVDPFAGTIKLENEKGEIAFLNDTEYKSIRENINNIKNVKFKKYTDEEIKNINSKKNSLELNTRIDRNAKMKRASKGDEEAHKIIDKLSSDFKEGRYAVDFLQKKQIDAFESELGTVMNNGIKKYKKEIGGDINDLNKYLTENAYKINQGITNLEDYPDYIQDIYKVSNKGAAKIREEMKKVGYDIDNSQKVYYHRNWDNTKAKAALNNIDEKDIKGLLKGSMTSEWKKLKGIDYDEKLANKLAKKISDKIYKNLRNLAHGETAVNLKQNNITSEMNQAIKELLENENIDDKTKELLDQLEYTSNKRDIKNNNPGIAKHKIRLDELYEYELPSGKKINLNDTFLDDNFLNNTTETFRNNISEAILKQNSKVEYKGQTYDLSNESDLYNFELESGNKEISRFVQDLKKGKVTEKLAGDGTLNKIALIGRNFATFMYMGKGYFAALPEVGMSLTKSMLNSGFKNIPEVYSIYKRLKLNKLTKEDKDFMDTIGWYLTSNSQKHSKTILQSGGDVVGGNATILDKIVNISDKGADIMARKIGGISFSDTIGKLLAATAEIERLRKISVKGGNFFANNKRLKASNFSNEEIKQLKEVFKKTKNDSTLSVLTNIKKELNNEELSNKLENYLLRKTDSMINNPTMGEQVVEMQDNLYAKTFFQFMNYTATSLGKLTHAGIYYRDAETITNLGGAFTFAALSQMSRTYIDYYNDKKKMKEKLEPGVLAWKTFNSTSQFAFPGWVIASAVSIAGYNLDSGRSSGLQRGIKGAASVDLFERFITKGIIDNSKKSATGDLSVKDLRVLTPNILLVNTFFNSKD